MKLFKQMRRERALSRFSIRQRREDETREEYDGYLNRKRVERASLESK